MLAGLTRAAPRLAELAARVDALDAAVVPVLAQHPARNPNRALRLSLALTLLFRLSLPLPLPPHPHPHQVSTTARRQLVSLRTPDGAVLSVSSGDGSAGAGSGSNGEGGGGGGRLELAELREPHDLGFAARRRGGSDAANAATWRLVPVSPPSAAAGGDSDSSAAAAAATVEQEPELWRRRRRQEHLAGSKEQEQPVALEAFAEPNHFVVPVDSEGGPTLRNTNLRPSPSPSLSPSPPILALAITRWARASATHSSQGHRASWLLAPPHSARRRSIQAGVCHATWLVCGSRERSGRWQREPCVGGGGGACAEPECGAARGRVPASELLGDGNNPNPTPA